jgi:hypothetical protein
MSMMDDNRSGSPSLSTIETQQRLMIVAINGLRDAIINSFPRITGTFTLSAAATTTVPNTSVTSTSIISLTPMNAAAAALMAGANSLYVSARTSGASFAVSTAGGGAAAGTEIFNYMLVNPS